MLLMPTVRLEVLARPAATRDRHNNRVYDWASAVRTPYDAHVEFLSSAETTQSNAQQVVTDVKVYLPPGAPVGEMDRVELDGAQYEVRGVPRAPRGWGAVAQLECLIVTARLVTG